MTTFKLCEIKCSGPFEVRLAKRYSFYFYGIETQNTRTVKSFINSWVERPLSGKNKDKEYKIFSNTRIYIGIGVRFISQHSLDNIY